MASKAMFSLSMTVVPLGRLSPPLRSRRALQGIWEGCKWATLPTTLPTPRCSMAVTCLGNRLIALGGFQTDRMTVVDVLDLEPFVGRPQALLHTPLRWNSLPDLSFARSSHTVQPDVANQALITIGGQRACSGGGSTAC